MEALLPVLMYYRKQILLASRLCLTLQIAQLIFVFVLFLIVLALAAGYVLKAENFQVDFLYF